MKKKHATLALCALLLLSGCAGGKNYAYVNGEPVSQAAYDSQHRLYLGMATQQFDIDNMAKRSVITDSLIRQDLAAHKVEITKDRVQKDYEDFLKIVGGVQGYQEMLKRLNVTDDDYKKALEALTASNLHREMYNKEHEPSEEEMKKYYEENKTSLDTVTASHILVDTEDEAKSVKERLDKGEDFATVAKEVSKDPGSAQNGGSLGESSPTQYVQEFADAVSKLQVGQISDPVKTQYGYHIIRLDAKKEGLEAHKEQIASALNSQKYQEYLDELLKKADVKISGEESSQASSQQDTSTEDSAADTQTSQASEN